MLMFFFSSSAVREPEERRKIDTCMTGIEETAGRATRAEWSGQASDKVGSECEKQEKKEEDTAVRTREARRGERKGAREEAARCDGEGTARQRGGSEEAARRRKWKGEVQAARICTS